MSQGEIVGTFWSLEARSLLEQLTLVSQNRRGLSVEVPHDLAERIHALELLF